MWLTSQIGPPVTDLSMPSPDLLKRESLEWGEVGMGGLQGDHETQTQKRLRGTPVSKALVIFSCPVT